MVLLDDALCKRKAEPPTAFLGGVAGIEYFLEMIVSNAFAGVADADQRISGSA